MTRVKLHLCIILSSLSLFPFRSDGFIIRRTKGIEKRQKVTIKLNKTKQNKTKQNIFARK